MKALKFIEKEEKIRKDYIKKTFRKNIGDPLLYSIVFNMDFVSSEDAVNIIGEQVMKMRKIINK